MQKQYDRNILSLTYHHICTMINMYLLVYSWWVWVSRHRPRSSRFCSEVLHRWGQLGSYRKQHPHLLYQGSASGEEHSPHTVHQEPRPSINSVCVNCVCSFRPSSTLRRGIRRLTWRIRIWFGTSGVCVLNRCTRYSSRRNPLLHFHVPVECLACMMICVCAGVFSVQRSGNSWWPPSYERIRIAHLQTGQRSGTVGVLQVPL